MDLGEATMFSIIVIVGGLFLSFLIFKVGPVNEELVDLDPLKAGAGEITGRVVNTIEFGADEAEGFSCDSGLNDAEILEKESFRNRIGAIEYIEGWDVENSAGTIGFLNGDLFKDSEEFEIALVKEVVSSCGEMDLGCEGETQIVKLKFGLCNGADVLYAGA